MTQEAISRVEERLWTTQHGDIIPYQELSDTHLINILAYIKKRAKEGVDITVDLGYCGDDDFTTVDVQTIYGREVSSELDYWGLRAEAKRRGLLTDKK